jgi:hypothetical protein
MGHDQWALVLLVGLWGWIVSMLGFIFRTFPRQGIFEAGPALRWGGSVLFFFALWVVGLLAA